MANNYIGNQYKIKIYKNSVDNSAEWESNKSYEPLTIVTYQNNSYISSQTVPTSIGSPKSNPTYWRITGKITKRKYVLVGDSFGCGIVNTGQAWVDGWIDYFAAMFPNDVFYYDPAGDTQFSGTSAFTTTSNKNFVGELQYTYNNKLGNTKPNEITDVVVLGGTNEVSGKTTDEIASAITTFCNKSRELFPNANIVIGIVGAQGQYMVHGSDIYKGYKKGAMINGASFLRDCINIGTLPAFLSTSDHWTAEGYTYINPMIAEMIINGEVKYSKRFSVPLSTMQSNISNPGGFTFALDCTMTEKALVFEFYITNGYEAGYVQLSQKPTVSASTRARNMWLIGLSKFNLVYPNGSVIFNCSYVYSRGDNYYNQVGGNASIRMLKDGNNWYLAYQCAYPVEGTYKSNNSVWALLQWCKNSKELPCFHELD